MLVTKILFTRLKPFIANPEETFLHFPAKDIRNNVCKFAPGELQCYQYELPLQPKFQKDGMLYEGKYSVMRTFIALLLFTFYSGSQHFQNRGCKSPNISIDQLQPFFSNLNDVHFLNLVLSLEIRFYFSFSFLLSAIFATHSQNIICQLFPLWSENMHIKKKLNISAVCALKRYAWPN